MGGAVSVTSVAANSEQVSLPVSQNFLSVAKLTAEDVAVKLHRMRLILFYNL